MFTAIITAVIGLFYFSWIGWLDLSLVYTTDTYIVPQILGGLILGVGFVVGGYCPGTSVVSAATGRYDGMIYFAGISLEYLSLAKCFHGLKTSITLLLWEELLSLIS